MAGRTGRESGVRAVTFKDIIKMIPLVGPLLSGLTGIKPTDVKIQHIGPAHDYDVFGYCTRCPRRDPSKQRYTDPPCSRVYKFQPGDDL